MEKMPIKCELCGTPVRIVGDTTKHYEPIKVELKQENAEWLINRVKVLTEAAQAVCDDWDLQCEDDKDKIDRLRKILAGDRPGGKE